MFEDTTLAASVLSNPASVQSLVLTEFQNRLSNVYSVADPNNSFNLLLEASSSINAQSVRYMESQFAAQYAVRATTSAELYNNMSDFDYLNMVAEPTSTTLNLTFDVDYLINNAVSFNTTYNRIVIPVGTQFYIGPLTFGIFYPINININVVNNNINILWDTTTPNPLQKLTTNMVPFVQYSSGGLNLITLTIPVTQFSVSTSVFTAVAQQGFIQKITYTDQFYAARVFTNIIPGGWTELNYTMSETVYDPTTPTAKLNIQNDVNNLVVTIPQIYFTNNQIGNQVLILVYTTKGALTLDLTAVEVSGANCNFDLSNPTTTQYSTILASLPTVDLTPAETSITGGSNALTFEELRKLVINGGLYKNIPITPTQLTAYAAKNGFSITKYIDNVTNRIYYASNTITGGQNGYIMVATGTIAVKPTSNNNPSTIITFPEENTTTILPTTTYTFNSMNNSCTPLTDVQVSILKNMSKVAFAAEVNANTYTQCPFHLVTYTGAQYPFTKSFNLLNPIVKSIQFVADNVMLTPQMSVVSGVVIHKNNGTGGYTLRLGVTKTTTMMAVAETNIVVYLSAIDTGGDNFYGIANLTGTSGSLYIYELDIPTTYYISQSGTFQSTMLASNSSMPTTVYINLNTTFTVTFLITASLYPGVTQDTSLVSGVSPLYNNMLGVSKQTMNIIFGTDLSPQVYNITNALWSSNTYATHPVNVYLSYPTDVYETNSLGGLVYTVVGGTVRLNKIHSSGDHILDDNGRPIIQHAAGSVVLDVNGNPVIMASRQLEYYVSSIMFDIRLFHSSNQSDITFVSELTSTLDSYFATISTIQENLLEQTSLYYVPNNTIGVATFSSGDNTPLSLNLEFSFAYTVYVSQATLDNVALKTAIIYDIVTITQSEMTKSVISLTDIAQNIKTQLADTIVSIDVNGIDTNLALQTVIVPSGITSTPIIAQELVYQPATDTLALQAAVTVTFKLAS